MNLSRRGFLRFLGVGMAAATMTPGQLIAAVSRPLATISLPPVGVFSHADMLAELQAITRRWFIPVYMKQVYESTPKLMELLTSTGKAQLA